MLIKLKVLAKVDGEWKSPNSLVNLDDAEARKLIANKQAVDPNLFGNVNVAPASGVDSMIEELISVEGIDDKLVGDIIDAGYTSIEKLSDAIADDLVKIKGIGVKTAEKIIDSAIGLYNKLN